MFRKKVCSFLAVLLVAALFLTGCGETQPSTSGGVESTTDGGNAPSGEDAAEGDVIRIGHVTGVTGNNALQGGFQVNGFVLAMEEINAAGGILGKQIEMVLEDEVDTAQTSVNAMLKVITQQDIMAVVGSHYSVFCIAALPNVAEEGIPFFASGSSSGISNENNPYTWQVRPLDTYQGVAMAMIAKDILEMENPCILYSTESTFVTLMERTLEAFEDMGVQIPPEAMFAFPEQETNFAPYFAQILDGGYDGIIQMSGQNPTTLVCQQAAIAGIEPGVNMKCLGSTSTCSQVVLTTAGDAANGWYAIGDWVPSTDKPVGSAFVDAYQERFGILPDMPSAVAYDSVYLIKQACETAGTTTDREAINEALKQVKNQEGCVSTYSYFDDHSFATSLFVTENVNGETVMRDTITYREP